MEPVGGAGPAGGGGPAPFLQKTYDMVDDSSADDIVSWSTTKASFVVWNPPEFAARLLPAYFKHNNFSSFIRQLNTYGFRKIDPERWEFANEDFIKDQKHLLKNIHRRKPIHSHSHPVDSLPDSERTALEEEIEGLSREKAGLHADLWLFKQQQSGTKIQLEDIERRLYDMEQRQAKMIAFLKKAVQNPKFVENLIKMAGAGAGASLVDFPVIHKKRRLPGVDYRSDVTENSFYDNHSSLSKQDVGQVFNRDFCDKLKLGLCPAAISDGNLVTASTQSSNGEGGNPQGEQNSGGNGRMECLSFVPETTELLDTGTSFCSRKDALFPGTVDDGDGLISCHLNLSLASSSMQIDKGLSLSRTPNSVTEEANANKEENLDRIVVTNQSTAPDSAEGNAPPLQEAMQTSNQGPQAAPGRVNDVFWEQFLTERPGSSDTEDASSSLRANLCDVQPEERNTENEGMWKNRKDMEQLTL